MKNPVRSLARLGLLVMVVCACARTGRSNAEESTPLSLVQKYIETRKLLAETRSDWQEEKSALQQTRRLLTREKEQLRENIRELNKSANLADQKRMQLDEKLGRLQKSEASLQARLEELRDRLHDQIPGLPPPLRERIAPQLERLGLDGPTVKQVRMPVSRQIGALVECLQEIQEFNRNLHLVEELKPSPADPEKKVLVQTLYIGLAKAYFLGEGDAHAGVGVPGNQGWEWSLRDDIAPAVRRAIEILGNGRDPEFVNLPISISSE